MHYVGPGMKTLVPRVIWQAESSSKGRRRARGSRHGTSSRSSPSSRVTGVLRGARRAGVHAGCWSGMAAAVLDWAVEGASFIPFLSRRQIGRSRGIPDRCVLARDGSELQFLWGLRARLPRWLRTRIRVLALTNPGISFAMTFTRRRGSHCPHAKTRPRSRLKQRHVGRRGAAAVDHSASRRLPAPPGLTPASRRRSHASLRVQAQRSQSRRPRAPTLTD